MIVEGVRASSQQEAAHQALYTVLPYAVSAIALIGADRMGSFVGCGASVAVALIHFRSQLQDKNDGLYFTCLSIAAYALETNSVFVGLGAALGVGYLGASKLSYNGFGGALGAAVAFCYLQTAYPPVSLFRGICGAGVGWYAAQLGNHGEMALFAATAFSVIAFTRWYVVAALGATAYALRYGQSRPLRACQLLGTFVGQSVQYFWPEGIAIGLGCLIIWQISKIAALRASILVIGGEIGRSYLRRQQEEALPAPLHTWIIPSSSSFHLTERKEGLGYVRSSLPDADESDTMIAQVGNIPLPPGPPSPEVTSQAIAHLRECHLELVEGVDRRWMPRFARVEKLCEFPYQKPTSFIEKLFHALPQRIAGTISLHRKPGREPPGFVYQWRWMNGDRTSSYWTKPFVPESDERSHDWWPQSESLSTCIRWPDRAIEDMGQDIQNYYIKGHFGSWATARHAFPVLRSLSFEPTTISSEYDSRISIDSNHVGVTLVSSGNRWTAPSSWGGHAKIAIEYLEAGKYALRYIHITRAADGVITRRFDKCTDTLRTKYTLTTNTRTVLKSLVRAAVANPPDVAAYSSCGGTRSAEGALTDNCYTYCKHFLDKLNIPIPSVRRMNLPNLFIPLVRL